MTIYSDTATSTTPACVAYKYNRPDTTQSAAYVENWSQHQYDINQYTVIIRQSSTAIQAQQSAAYTVDTISYSIKKKPPHMNGHRKGYNEIQDTFNTLSISLTLGHLINISILSTLAYITNT